MKLIWIDTAEKALESKLDSVGSEGLKRSGTCG